MADTVQKWVTEHEVRGKYEVAARYHYFTDKGMNEAYTHTYGIYFNSIVFERESTRPAGRDTLIVKQTIIRPEMGFLFASGHPLQKDFDWKVVDSNLGMIVLAIGGTGIHEFDKEGEKAFVPYIGIGLGFFLGFERISAHIYKDQVGGESHLQWHDTCYRHSFSGHALLGATMKESGRFSYVGEIRWTQAGKGRLKRMSLSQEELAQGWGEAFRDFQHPDFNFTGPSINIGIRW